MQFDHEADELSPAELRSLISQAGEEITDDDGNVLGFISAPAKIKVARTYLANGGYLVVSREDDWGDFIGVEYDALWDHKTRQHYPSGYSARVFTAADLDTAVAKAAAYMAGTDPEPATPS